MNKRKLTITFEKHEVFVLRNLKETKTAWCKSCSQSVQMITAEKAALLANVNVRVIFRLIDEGTLHFTETKDDPVLICVQSLLLLS